MPILNKRSIKVGKRRSYVKTTNILNFDRKDAPYKTNDFAAFLVARASPKADTGSTQFPGSPLYLERRP